MSRTIKFAKAGGPEVLEFLETEVPAPGPTEVRIKVKAIGINRAESMWRTDVYIEPVAKFPAGLGYEAAGLVDSVGRDVSGVAVGDEVNVIPSFSMNQYHTYGEVILVPDYAVVKHPKSLSFAEAASVWMMFVTAYGALIEDAKVKQGRLCHDSYPPDRADTVRRGQRNPLRLSPIRQGRRRPARFQPALHRHDGPLGSGGDRWLRTGPRSHPVR